MMKMKFQKWIAALISFVMIGIIFSMLPMTSLTASAICCRKDGFDKSKYTLTGNMAEDVATIAKSQKGRTGSQLGYTEAWCDEFVADCIENAGADSSIVGHGGTVADFESVMRKKGAVQVSSPQTGDLVFFTYSHVEIVTKVENGTVYCAGGNNGGTGNYKTNYCAGERKLYATPRLYLRPNYKRIPVDKAPTWANLDKNQIWYDLKDTIVLTPSSDTATDYWISITKDGNSVVNEHINGAYSIAANSLGIGEYHTWISAVNSAGSIDSNHLDFSVVGAATYLNVYASKNTYSLKETVSIHVDTICAKGQVIGIDKIGSGRVITEGCESTYTIEANKLGVGKYSAYFSVYNGSGGIDTKRVEFSIYDKLISPTPTITTLSSSSLKLTWKAEPNATSYRIDRRKSGADAYETIATTNQTTYTDTGLEANTKYWYRVYAVAGSDKSSEKNSVSGTTDKINNKCSVTWNDNYDGGSTSGTILFIGEKFGIYANSGSNRSGYTFDGWYTEASGGTKITSDTKVPNVAKLVLYAHWTPNKYTIHFNANGGSCSKLSASIQYRNTYGQLPEAQREGYRFLGWYTLKDKGVLVTSDTVFLLTKDQTLYAHWEKINLLGDLSQDNKITLIDLILLQKYLLRQASLTTDQSTLANLNEDGIINVIDLMLLKRTLLNP